MLSAPAPVLVDRGLDRNDVLSADGPFSDGQRQHIQRITKKRCGRQPKMKKVKKIGGWNLTVKFVRAWVETKNCGLKID